jgi:mono/diheme cytochrome c family protein
MTLGQAHSVVSYMRRVRARTGTLPTVSAPEGVAALIVGRYCSSCHMLDGEGSSSAPDLTTVGRTRDAKWLREWITDPSLVDPAASMPAFGAFLSEDELEAIVAHLAARK